MYKGNEILHILETIQLNSVHFGGAPQIYRETLIAFGGFLLFLLPNRNKARKDQYKHG